MQGSTEFEIDVVVPDSAKRIPRMRAQAQSGFYLLWRSIGDIRHARFVKRLMRMHFC